MIKTLSEAGPQHCFPVEDGFMCCNYTKRKIKDVIVAIFPNAGDYMRFPIPWAWKKRKKPEEKAVTPASGPVGVNVLAVVINPIKNEKTPVVENKGSNRL